MAGRGRPPSSPGQRKHITDNVIAHVSVLLCGLIMPRAATAPRHQLPWWSGTSFTSGSMSTSRAANTRNTRAWTIPG
jgi:hypothetical protein